MDYTREKLIEICEKAIVKQTNWYNRDSASAQMGIGKCWALLKAGCEFEIQTIKQNPDGNCVTDERTIWIQLFVHDFGWFENGAEEAEDQRGSTGDWNDNYLYYLPTEKRLEESDNGDWY